MSLLWPEKYALHLFQGRSWVAGKIYKEFNDEENPWDLGKVTERLLGSISPARVLRPDLEVTISDDCARTVLLPWQDRVRTAAQLTSYAHACLESNGIALNNDWIVRALFRRYGGAGIALAVPRELVAQLVALSARYRMRLRSLLPLTATAYWSATGQMRNGDSLLFLAEQSRITLLRHKGRRLAALDVEPAVRDREQAVLRLLRRQVLVSAPSISLWSVLSNDRLEGVFTTHAPDAIVKPVFKKFWKLND